ncbi:MAG: MBL fold metallo-hydrolase, partial [Clostridiales bacterium]|nr:MBL fold metallo-hydrolase [Clostridiales bacterium]
RGCIIVETGCYAEKSEYMDILNGLSVKPENVGLIVITHGHWDHFARAAELKEITGAPILCHKNAVKALWEGDPQNYKPRGEEGRNFVKLISGDTPDTIIPVKPDIVLDFESPDESFDLKPYGIDGRIIFTPGHSNCSISIVLDSGDAIVGDMLLTSPFTGKLCLGLIAEDEALLVESLRTLTSVARTFFGGHSGPYDVEDVKALLS